jgi:hypothetical protein
VTFTTTSRTAQRCKGCRREAERKRVRQRQAKTLTEALEFFKKEGAKGGKLSGEARMKKLTPGQRSELSEEKLRERGKQAAAARWAGHEAKRPASARKKPSQ